MTKNLIVKNHIFKTNIVFDIAITVSTARKLS